MVNHIVMWNFKPELMQEEREAAFMQIEKNLYAVKDMAPGIISLEVILNKLPGSNRDLALISTFESLQALDAYQVHPAHIKAGEYIKTVVCDRSCLDY